MHNCDCTCRWRYVPWTHPLTADHRDAKSELCSGSIPLSAINSCGAANRNSARWLADLRDRVGPTTLPKLHIPRQILDCAAKSERNNTPRKPIEEAQVSRFYSRWQVGRGVTCSQDGRTPYPSAHNETCKAGFYTFIPHAGSLASAEERQEQPASAGFFLLAVSTGANLV